MLILLRSVSIDLFSIVAGTPLVAIPRRLMLFLLIDPRNLLTTMTRMVTLTIIIMFLMIETSILLTTITRMMSLMISTSFLLTSMNRIILPLGSVYRFVNNNLVIISTSYFHPSTVPILEQGGRLYCTHFFILSIIDVTYESLIKEGSITSSLCFERAYNW